MAEPSHIRATRTAYDTVAVSYAELLASGLDGKPVDRALLRLFAELVRQAGGGPVADLGCGPGRVTAHLHELGLDVFGIDLSPGMVAEARRRHPGLRFSEGSMAALDLPDGRLAGIVSWYSVIHTPPEELPGLFAELARVLVPGGRLLLAFQAGDERVRLEHAYGHPISLDAYRLAPDRVEGLLGAAGLAVHARMLREPTPPEKVRQAYLLAQRASSNQSPEGRCS
jgi:SAM-dependent methyltransferase